MAYFDNPFMPSTSSYVPQNNTTDLGNGFQGGSRWVGGALQTAQPGYGWDANGQFVNINQAQLANQAKIQAQQDLAGLGSPAQIAAQSAAAADPFASQRGQYQNSLSQIMNGQFTPNDQSYAWRLGQGQQALERSAAAKGYLGSGNILAELQNYGQGAASQEYQNQYNRLLPLTGATTGSPGAAGASIAATYGWRNNALANLGGAQALGQPGGGGMSIGSSNTSGLYGGGGASGSGGGGGSLFNPGSFLGGSGGSSAIAGGSTSGDAAHAAYRAELDAAAAQQARAMGGGTQFPGYSGGLEGGGFTPNVNGVPGMNTLGTSGNAADIQAFTGDPSDGGTAGGGGSGPTPQDIAKWGPNPYPGNPYVIFRKDVGWTQADNTGYAR